MFNHFDSSVNPDEAVHTVDFITAHLERWCTVNNPITPITVVKPHHINFERGV